MTSFGFGVDQGDLAGFLDRLGREFAQHAAEVGDAAAQELESALRASIRARLNKDPTGAMENSITRRVLSDSEGRVLMRVGVNVPYGRIQDEGGTIRPHGSKLAVPLSFGPAPRGVWPRDVPDLFVLDIPSKPNPFLVRRTQKKAPQKKAPQKKTGLEFWYVLVDSVDIPGTGYMAAALDEGDEAAQRAVLATIQRILDAAGEPR